MPRIKTTTLKLRFSNNREGIVDLTSTGIGSIDTPSTHIYVFGSGFITFKPKEGVRVPFLKTPQDVLNYFRQTWERLEKERVK